MEKTWWKEAVVYQIYPRSFKDSNGDGIGDINGIISKLDYIKLLGVDVIWLCPIYGSPNDDNGYDISNYRDIMNEFGTMKDFEILLNEAHKKGIKIIMDLVVNHTSDEHAWFVESKKSEESKYKDYYIWREPKDGKEPNNWGAFFGGSVWEYSKEREMYYLHLFSQKQPDLNWDNEVLRNEVYDMMTWWLDKGIDGFRMDVINFISKPSEMPDGKVLGENIYGNTGEFIISGPNVHKYMKEMNEKVLSKYDIMTVGETGGVTVDEAKKFAGFESDELNMVFQFEHMDLDFGEFSKWNDVPPKLTELKKTLSKWQTELHDKAWNSLYWSNHDQPRVVSRFGNDKNYWEKSAKMLAICLHMMQGTPFIYQGEEIGMTNAYFKSIEECRDLEILNSYNDLVGRGVFSHDKMMSCINYKGRDNARTPMQWNNSEFAGFSTVNPWIRTNNNYDKINAESQIEDEDSIFNFYRKLIQLRKENEIIVYGKYELLNPESEDLFVYTREYEGAKILVICNWTDKEQLYTFPEEWKTHKKVLLISNYKETAEDLSILLKPYEARVYITK